MKSLKLIIATFAFILLGIISNAQTITFQTKDGNSREIEFSNKTLGGKGIMIHPDELIEYSEIEKISTADFKTYEKISKKVSKKSNRHIKLIFTGDQNLYALQLDKLQKKRTGAHTARAAGGILAIIGAISGDRDLYAAGMVTYGVGTVAKDINTEKTMATQNKAIYDLQNNQNKPKEETEEEQYRREYGNENIDAFLALLDKEYDRALALANAGETSKDANHRLTAIWVKATIATEQQNMEVAEKEYERLVIFDPEINSIEEVGETMEIIIEEVEKMRES